MKDIFDDKRDLLYVHPELNVYNNSIFDLYDILENSHFDNDLNYLGDYKEDIKEELFYNDMIELLYNNEESEIFNLLDNNDNKIEIMTEDYEENVVFVIASIGEIHRIISNKLQEIGIKYTGLLTTKETIINLVEDYDDLICKIFEPQTNTSIYMGVSEFYKDVD